MSDSESNTLKMWTHILFKNSKLNVDANALQIFWLTLLCGLLFSMVFMTSVPCGRGRACLWPGLSFQGCVQSEQFWKIDLVSPNRANNSFKWNKNKVSWGAKFMWLVVCDGKFFVSSWLGHKFPNMVKHYFGYIHESACGWDNILFYFY